MQNIIIHTDGASRGNPGPGAAAFILTDENKKVIQGKASFIGETTNNVAEYTAMLNALQEVKKIAPNGIQLFSDSELMVRQINGKYKVKNAVLKELHTQCMKLLEEFADWQVTHIPRDENKQADNLVNRAMNLQKDVQLNKRTCAPKGEKIKLGILISGSGTTMVNIQNQIDAGHLNAEIAVVISSRSTVKGIERAKEMGLKLDIVRKKDFADIEQFSNHLGEVFQAANVDLVVLAGWLCLWRIPEEYENRVMNIHPALLPSFGGQGMWGHHVHEAVLKAGCKISGCTVHFCTNEYDKGPIIVQRCCEVKDDDDAETLAAKVFEQECIAYPEAIQLFAEKRLSIENSITKRLDV